MLGRKIKIIAKTFFGLEETLKNEIEAIGGKKIKVLNRAVEFEGDLELLYTANLKLRTALSILTPIFEFRAKDNDELYKGIYSFDWGRIFNLHQTFSIHAVVFSDFFNHTQFVALKCKDAIVDQFRSKYNDRPDVDKKFADIKIIIHASQDKFTVLLDTSGKALFQRGYKTELTEAPLNEVLAAGILLQSGWDKKSAFIDPMCGSGTFLIEAAMLASNFAPGLLRKRFGFQNYRNYDATLWKSILDKASNEVNRDISMIYGNDISEKVIEIAQENIRNSGFTHQIKLSCSDFRDYEPEAKEGLLITNPPYDERLKEENIDELYADLGTKFKHGFSKYKCWVFSGNLSALKNIGLKTSKKIKLFNGSIEGRLNLYEMYEGSKKDQFEEQA
jgi:putative N6-adenine-specific DNA methylase